MKEEYGTVSGNLKKIIKNPKWQITFATTAILLGGFAFAMQPKEQTDGVEKKPGISSENNRKAEKSLAKVSPQKTSSPSREVKIEKENQQETAEHTVEERKYDYPEVGIQQGEGIPIYYTVAEGNTAQSIEEWFGVDWGYLVQLNPMLDPNNEGMNLDGTPLYVSQQIVVRKENV